MSLIISKINATVLRVAVLVSFVLAVAATVAMLLMKHVHMLHLVHVALTVLTFLLIALYLHVSARIASLAAYRELQRRLTVDASVRFVTLMREGSPLFNVCAGVLAKSGIYVKNREALVTLAKLKTVGAVGSSAAREGYAVTLSTLEQMGLTLSDDAEALPLRIVLGEIEPNCDFALTHNKITHLLKAVYVSRVYARCIRTLRCAIAAAAVAAITLCALKQFTYASAAFAALGAVEVLLIRNIERGAERLTFAKIAKS